MVSNLNFKGISGTAYSPEGKTSFNLPDDDATIKITGDQKYPRYKIAVKKGDDYKPLEKQDKFYYRIKCDQVDKNSKIISDTCDSLHIQNLKDQASLVLNKTRAFIDKAIGKDTSIKLDKSSSIDVDEESTFNVETPNVEVGDGGNCKLTVSGKKFLFNG